MWPVEIIPGMGRGGIKENDGGGEIQLCYIEEHCKCHNEPPLQQ
jgi:hypothetical protein